MAPFFGGHAAATRVTVDALARPRIDGSFRCAVQQRGHETVAAAGGVVSLIVEFGELAFGEQRTRMIKETKRHAKSCAVFHRALGHADYSAVNKNARTQMGPSSASRWGTPPAAPGDLVLFELYVHEAPKNDVGERITMAFNCQSDQLDAWFGAVRFSGATGRPARYDAVTDRRYHASSDG